VPVAAFQVLVGERSQPSNLDLTFLCQLPVVRTVRPGGFEDAAHLLLLLLLPFSAMRLA
jgi:hypothetical protein